MFTRNFQNPGSDDDTPQKTKHISFIVCSPKRTGFGGGFGLSGFASELC